MSAVWPAAARASTASATQKSGSWPGRRDLPVLALRHQYPGQLLAQARQILTHPPQARDDLADVIQAREVRAV